MSFFSKTKSSTAAIIIIILSVAVIGIVLETQAIRSFAADPANYAVIYDFDFTRTYDEVDVEISITIKENVGFVSKSVFFEITMDLDDGEQIETSSFTFDLKTGTYAHTFTLDIDDEVVETIEEDGRIEVDLDLKYTFLIYGVNSMISKNIEKTIYLP